MPFDPVFFGAGKRPPELEAVGPHAKSPTLFDEEARVPMESMVNAVYGTHPTDEGKLGEPGRAFLARLEHWDRRLENRRFLMGDELTVADIALFTRTGRSPGGVPAACHTTQPAYRMAPTRAPTRTRRARPTDELAVMLDCAAPLRATTGAHSVEDDRYHDSFAGR